VTIYTDGGCKPNPGPGGWGALLLAANGTTKELSGAAAETTNNRMELTAAIEALRALKGPCRVTLVTDSEYLKNGISGWLADWVQNNWLTSGDQPVKNRDLWQALYAETQRHDITWEWVKGHAGDEHNEHVDQLATAARRELTGPDEPADAANNAPATPPEYEIALRVSSTHGSGGWAYRVARLADADMGELHTGSDPDASSSRLELVAALDALQQMPPGAAVRVFCPGDYLYRGMTQWIAGWQRRNWQTASKKPVKNRDLWRALLAEAEQRPVYWQLEPDDTPPLARDLDEIAADAARRK